MTMAEKKSTYEVLTTMGEYTIINRKTSYLPFVVCWLFNTDDYTWAQGHYLATYEDALVFMKIAVQ